MADAWHILCETIKKSHKIRTSHRTIWIVIFIFSTTFLLFARKNQNKTHEMHKKLLQKSEKIEWFAVEFIKFQRNLFSFSQRFFFFFAQFVCLLRAFIFFSRRRQPIGNACTRFFLLFLYSQNKMHFSISIFSLIILPCTITLFSFVLQTNCEITFPAIILFLLPFFSISVWLHLKLAAYESCRCLLRLFQLLTVAWRKASTEQWNKYRIGCGTHAPTYTIKYKFELTLVWQFVRVRSHCRFDGFLAHFELELVRFSNGKHFCLRFEIDELKAKMSNCLN